MAGNYHLPLPSIFKGGINASLLQTDCVQFCPVEKLLEKIVRKHDNSKLCSPHKGSWDITTYRLLMTNAVPQELASSILFMDFPENRGRTLHSYVNKYLSVDMNSFTRRLDTAIRNTISHFSIVKPTRCTSFLNLFYFGVALYMFRTVFPAIIRSLRPYIQHQVYVKQILLSAY